MQINFNTNLYNQSKNINFGAFSKRSEKIIRKDIAKYNNPELLKDTEELIAKENQRKDRTIKVSSYRAVDHNYVPIGFRTVTVVNNLTHDKYKTSVCCDLPDCYQQLTDKINSQDII